MLELTETSNVITHRTQAKRLIALTTSSDDVDSIDPDSVDFEPLMKSFNGAAITDLSKIHNTARQGQYNCSYSHTYDTCMGTHDNGSGSYGYLSEDDGFRDDENEYNFEHDHPSNWFTSMKSAFCTSLSSQTSVFLRGNQCQIFQGHFYDPIKNDNDEAITNEKSNTSAVLICLTFIAIILFSGTISTVIAHLTSIGPERKIAEVSQSFFYKHNRVSPQGKGLAPPIGTRLPSTFDVFADIDDLPLELLDTPIFWHIPRSAGTSMKNVFSTCLGKVLAAEVGGLDEHRLDDRILTVKKPNGVYVNVDLYTTQGISRARDLGFIQSNLAEISFTPFVHESSKLFDQNHRGRLFTIIRNPTERIVSLYYFLRLWDNNVKAQSLEDFIITSGDNWMVRTLTGTVADAPIDESNLNVAKETLRRKFLVGLLEDKTESFRRFEELLELGFPSPLSDSCKNRILYFDWHVKNPHPIPDQAILGNIEKMNGFDVQLFEYARQLFQEQSKLFS